MVVNGHKLFKVLFGKRKTVDTFKTLDHFYKLEVIKCSLCFQLIYGALSYLSG